MDYEKKYKEALERARRIKNGEDDWRYSDLIEIGPALTEIFPELRESEDEITRKRLINLIRELASATLPIMTSGYFIDGQDKRYIAYLEKQKDSFENGRQLGIMQEQARQELGWPDEKKKEHQNNSDAPEKALGRDLISPKDKDKNLDEIAQDYVDGVKEYNPEPTWDLIQTAVCYGYHYCEQKEQKPAEWSYPYGENETVDKLIAIAECLEMDGDCLFNGYSGTECGKFLRELARKQVECKPAEWSDEDREMIQSIITNGCVDDKQEHWLQMLPERICQSKQEWSEEDDQLIGFIFDLLNSLVWRKEWAMDKKECLERLKSLRPSWKPSEWQMSMFLAVINDPNNAGSESCYLTLKSIYEQLKKL